MEVVKEVHQQNTQLSQRNMQTQPRPYSNAERQRRYREKKKANTIIARTIYTFSQSDSQPQQHDVHINECQPKSSAERQRKYRKTLRERREQQKDNINAVTVLNAPYTYSFNRLQNVDPAERARKRLLNQQRQSRFRARQRIAKRQNNCRHKDDLPCVSDSLESTASSSIEESKEKDLQFCRICFTAEGKLNSMKTDKDLDEAYGTLTGLSKRHEENVSPYICTECSGQLMSCINFRNRSIRAYLLLLEILRKHDSISLEVLQKLNQCQNVNSDNPDITQNSHSIQHNNMEMPIDIKKETEYTESQDFDPYGIKVKDEYSFNEDNVKDEDTMSSSMSNFPEETLFHDVDVAKNELYNAGSNAYTFHDEYTGAFQGDDGLDCNVSEEQMHQVISKNISVRPAMLSDHNYTCCNETADTHDSVPAMSRDVLAQGTVDTDDTRYYNRMNGQTPAQYVAVHEIKVEYDGAANQEYISTEQTTSRDTVCRSTTTEDVIHDIKAENDRDVECGSTTTKALFAEDIKVEIKQEIITPEDCTNIDMMCRSLLPSNVSVNSVNVENCVMNQDDASEGATNTDVKRGDVLLGEDYSSAAGLPAAETIHRVQSVPQVTKISNDLMRRSYDMRTTGAKKPFPCVICDKPFKLLKNLRLHINRHLGVKPYWCKICDKRFSFKVNLISHIRLHLGVKPFSCDTCGWAFALKSNLVKHMRVHGF